MIILGCHDVWSTSELHTHSLLSFSDLFMLPSGGSNLYLSGVQILSTLSTTDGQWSLYDPFKIKQSSGI